MRPFSVFIAVILSAFPSSAATHYVSNQSVHPAPPYTNWTTAALNIQQAVDAAVAGEAVVVTNGVYSGPVSLMMRLTLLSVNGPQLTVINGYPSNSAVAQLEDGASLTGFTLSNAERGALCRSTNAFVTNCIITLNSAWISGGGVIRGTLFNCTISGNRATGIHSRDIYGEHDYPGAGGGAWNSILYNCILSGNSSSDYGGGAYNCTLYNCVLSNNSASGRVYQVGGGAYQSTLYNCILTGNLAGLAAGGATGCTLYNCTVSGNSASWAGAVDYCTAYNCTLVANTNSGTSTSGAVETSTLNNCIVVSNTAPCGNYSSSTLLNYSCTAPLPTNGVGNISADPLFVDYAHGNLRLQSNSPCLNAGSNTYLTNSTDLDGRPRMVGSTVDMGAYELQPGISGAFIGWLQQYSLPTDGSADYVDSDHEGMNNWQEWVCATDPTNPLSALRLVSTVPAGTNTSVTWQSIAGVDYFLERSTSAGIAQPFMPLASGISGQPGITTFTDSNGAVASLQFYRVGVRY